MEGLKTSNEGGMGEKIKKGLRAAVAATALLVTPPAEKAEAASPQSVNSCAEVDQQYTDCEALVQELAKSPLGVGVALSSARVKGWEPYAKALEKKIGAIDTSKERPAKDWRKKFDAEEREGDKVLAESSYRDEIERVLNDFNKKNADKLNQLKAALKEQAETEKKLIVLRQGNTSNPSADTARKIDELLGSSALCKSEVDAFTRILAEMLENELKGIATPTAR